MNHKAVAIVGLGSILPDAFTPQAFWQNILSRRYSITDVTNERWNPALYFNPDPSVPDKTYAKIGAWVRGFKFDPIKLGIAIPPRVLSVMDEVQQWSIAASHQALQDFGYPKRVLDPNRVAVIFGNALSGENHYRTSMRIFVPEYQEALRQLPDFKSLPESLQKTLLEGMQASIQSRIPTISEDTMPGELSNIIAGRVANVFNFSGPNFVTDAACASSLAALQTSVEGLLSNRFDVALTGGIDRSMGPESFVKFCKIGALSADGSRPYSEGANGFVQGEGAVVFLLKRLEDAERDGDKIYAVVRGIGSSSDGKGKGITAPNPLGQQRAIERGWQDANLSPVTAGLIEGHGTSTRVGDLAEINSLNAVLGPLGIPVGKIALGSVKSNIGHLKSASGAAGLLKAILALHEHILPPSANFDRPNSNVDFSQLPFHVITQSKSWEVSKGEVRRAGVSSFGFGGTNFHVVLEEYLPGVLSHEERIFPAAQVTQAVVQIAVAQSPIPANTLQKAVVQTVDLESIKTYVQGVMSEKTGYPPEMLDLDLDLEADLGVDTVKQAELFAAVRTHYDIPRREDLRLSDYNTLNKVIGFLEDALKSREPQALPTAQAVVAPVIVDKQPAAPVSGPSREEVQAHILAAVSEKTGYPAEMLDLGLDLEADLGIDTVKQAELFASMRTFYGIPRREDLRLSDYNTLNKVVDFINNSLPQGTVVAAVSTQVDPKTVEPRPVSKVSATAPYQGLLFVSSDTVAGLEALLGERIEQARQGNLPVPGCPTFEELKKSERMAIDFVNGEELIKRAEKALKGLEDDAHTVWNAYTAQGIYRGHGTPGKVVFMFPGQGSQYVNMLRDMMAVEPLVGETFKEADEVMSPILGKSLTSYIFVDGGEDAVKEGEKALKNTEITQPAMLAANVALLKVMKKFGFTPDLVIGHSLGEYAALVAAGVLTFAEALEVVSARGREMAKVSMADNGCMAAVSAPLGEVERILKTLTEYVVLANVNSPLQSVIGGSTVGVEAAISAFQAAGFQAQKIPVSHAFHTKIVAPASQPLRQVIARMNIHTPRIPVVANVTGDLYPTQREDILDILAQQVASPVQFVHSMQTLYSEGVRIYVEIGPKRVLNALANDNLKGREDVTILSTNHPRKGGLASFNEALCGLYAAGVCAKTPQPETKETLEIKSETVIMEPAPVFHSPEIMDGRLPLTGSVIISGAGLGLPGKNRHVFDDGNVQRILGGEMLIEPLPDSAREGMLEKRVTRLVKSDAGAVMEEIDQLDQVLKLAGQSGEFDLEAEYGVSAERIEALDISTKLAIAAGIEALRDASIPLVMNYRRTSKGTFLPDRWMLPSGLKDETGVIFASAFPGLERMASETKRFYDYQNLVQRLEELVGLQKSVTDQQSDLFKTLEGRIAVLKAEIAANDYHFDRRFVFRVLSMGHSQFAEYIGARGPNTSVNAACATTTHAVNLAEDWIRAGRCRRVIVVSGDNVTSEPLVSWIGTSLFASGAATVEGDLRHAALPFDRRRNGLIMGMGAAALVVESEDAARERGVRGICELLASQIANSAFHGTRLDVEHVSEVMRRLLAQAEKRFDIHPGQIAANTVFMSHETYTPARGGSASAEIRALRENFGENANQVIIANTKGFTGHTMGVGIEDVIAVKALEFETVPPIAHIDDGFEPDPDLGGLRLSKGGKYPVQYALRLGAGFGSQIAMTLMRKIPGEGVRVNQEVFKRWLKRSSGYEQVDLEVTKRTLRIRNTGQPINLPASSTWEMGQGPTMWAARMGDQVLKTTPVVSVAQPKPAEMVKQPASQPEPVLIMETKGAAAGVEEVKKYVLEMVSEKTGYPVEMLDLGLDLEADLGIDTVKQAELFASIRTHYNIERREDLRLSDYNTLTKVIGFMMDAIQPAAKQPETVAKVTPEPTPASEAQPEIEKVIEQLPVTLRSHYKLPHADELYQQNFDAIEFIKDHVEPTPAEKDTLVELMKAGQLDAARESQGGVVVTPKLPIPTSKSIKRRVPISVLRPRLELCIASGVELEPGSQVVVVGDHGKTGEMLGRRLRSRKIQVLNLDPEISTQKIGETIAGWLAKGPICGVYFLPGLDIEPKLSEITIDTWKAEEERRVYALFAVMKALPETKFLVCSTRMGGFHGYSGKGSLSPFGGAISGFAKSLAREQEGLFVKVVDFSKTFSAAGIAAILIDETLKDPGVVEVGWEGELRFGIALLEKPIENTPVFAMDAQTVFVVSGGAGGIIAPIVLDLAQATQATFYLLDRAALPDATDPDLPRLKTDRNALKVEMLKRFSKDGVPAKPAQVEQKLAALDRGAAALEMIAKVEHAGSKVHFLVCDVTDAMSMNETVQKIMQTSGKVDVFIHAAGIERSRKLENKPEEEFRSVFGVKADGFFNLFKAFEDQKMLPKSIILFSSVAGRFGNAGQTDYSSANDLLCKLSTAIRSQYPSIRAVAIDWSAWAEVGMATRGFIPEVMERAGIDMLKTDEAAPMVRAELLGSTDSEVVMAGALGILLESKCEQGGMDIALADAALREGKPIHHMFAHLTSLDLQKGITLEAVLDPKKESYLRDHALNGIPILPGVVGIEGFSIAARHIASVLSGGKAGFEIANLQDIKFLTPFKFYRNEPRQILWKAQAVQEAKGLVVYVTLESDLTLKTKRIEHFLHFTGKVHLKSAMEKEQDTVIIRVPQWNGGPTVMADDIYRLYFHGPSFQVLEGVQRSGDMVLGKFRKPTPVQDEEQQSSLMIPMLVELCFQTAGLWEASSTGILALPRSVQKLVVYRNKVNGVPIFAEVKPVQDCEGLHFDARVVDADGRLYLELKEYRTTPLPYTVEKELLNPFAMLAKESL